MKKQNRTDTFDITIETYAKLAKFNARSVVLITFHKFIQIRVHVRLIVYLTVKQTSIYEIHCINVLGALFFV